MNYLRPMFEPYGKPMRVVDVELADGVVYPVFKEMIMHYSPYFLACLSIDSPNSRVFKVKLTKPVWAPIFGFVVDWMMCGRSLKSTEVNPPVVEYINDELVYRDHRRPTVRECVDIWLLAEYLGMPGLQNYMIYHLATKSNIARLGLVLPCCAREQIPEDYAYHVPNHVLTRVWDNTPPGSKLRKFFVAVVCHSGMKKDPGIVGRLRPDIISGFLEHYDHINFSVSEYFDDIRHGLHPNDDTAKKMFCRFFGPLSPPEFFVRE